VARQRPRFNREAQQTNPHRTELELLRRAAGPRTTRRWLRWKQIEVDCPAEPPIFSRCSPKGPPPEPRFRQLCHVSSLRAQLTSRRYPAR
jgi:hypothetical protein